MQAQEAREHVRYKSLNSENEPNDHLFRYYALIGTHKFGDLHVLELSWESGIVRRERLLSWESWPASKTQRKLVIPG
jgi:hypothetical protein